MVAKRRTKAKRKASTLRAPAKKKISPKRKKATSKTSKKTAKKSRRASVKKKSTTKKKKKAAAKKKVAKKKKPATAARKKNTTTKKASTTRIASTKVSASYASRKKKKYLTAKHLAYFKERLLEWEKTLREEASNAVTHMQNESIHSADINDRATHEEEFGREIKTHDRERKLIRKIHISLALIDKGEFGHCEECGEPIGLIRLKARPTATMCVDCKTVAEHIERQV